MRRAHAGFTLVELLVALFALSLLAVMSYRGIDGMMRAQASTEARADDVLTLQIGLAQWAADLDAIEQIPGLKAIEWNGRVLRLTRRSTASPTDGLLVVAWTRRIVGDKGMWLRWQSPPVTTRGDIEQAWQRADLWSQNAGSDDQAREVAVTPLDDWQIFFFRENAWTNPQSSDVTSASIASVARTAASGAAAVNPTQQPDGVRLVLQLPANQAVAGTITRDWVRPQVTNVRTSS
ncbi:PulJ/GspJ family protein [Ramlibacter sp. PS4R-6]|uniref:PulJ/GspJ family protein n=1 Tax=Ramlibacter sp. PS4R-6 TaxID=3133438 RepID=UPI0030B2DE7B